MGPGLIIWVIGIPITIWRPRKTVPGSWQAHAYLALRYAAIWLLLGYLLLLLPGLGRVRDEPMLIPLFAGLGAFLLSPLSTCAIALDAQRRWFALFNSYLAILFACGVIWNCIIQLLVYLLIDPGSGSPWRIALVSVAGLMCAAALVFMLELYTLIRQPRARTEP